MESIIVLYPFTGSRILYSRHRFLEIRIERAKILSSRDETAHIDQGFQLNDPAIFLAPLSELCHTGSINNEGEFKWQN